MEGLAQTSARSLGHGSLGSQLARRPDVCAAATAGGGRWGGTLSTLDDALAFARTTRQSVLTTIRRNGRPQLSNVVHTVSDDGIIRISITADRAKYHNLVREPWAALYVTSANFFAYAVIECDASLTPVAARADDATVDELVAVYRAAMGEHDDWDEFRAAMVSDRRVVVRLSPTRAYGMVPRGSGTSS
jgi:PPOX class probable F420-dependent enzyme